MGVSLVPIHCACGELVGHEIRMGREHQSAERRDPYDGVCLALERRTDEGRRWAYIGLAHGAIPRRDYWAVVESLVDLGYEWVAYEHDGKVSTVTKAEVRRRTRGK